MAEFKQVVSARVRLARREDMPHVLALAQQLADFENRTDFCVATIAKLESTLCDQEPFQGPTALLLELSSASDGDPPLRSAAEDLDKSAAQSFLSDLRKPEGTSSDVALRAPIDDVHALAFKSMEDRTVAGFVVFFPNYSTFLAKPGFYIEDLYVRECYRGHGFGTMLLKSVARLAVALDYGRVEWCVLDWNVNAIKFYEGMGAKVYPDWKMCRLTC